MKTPNHLAKGQPPWIVVPSTVYINIEARHESMRIGSDPAIAGMRPTPTDAA
ncbi:MAG: hypothetical protein AB7V26_10990 [Lysobacterales bacterium]